MRGLDREGLKLELELWKLLYLSKLVCEREEAVIYFSDQIITEEWKTIQENIFDIFSSNSSSRVIESYQLSCQEIMPEGKLRNFALGLVDEWAKSAYPGSQGKDNETLAGAPEPIQNIVRELSPQESIPKPIFDVRFFASQYALYKFNEGLIINSKEVSKAEFFRKATTPGSNNAPTPFDTIVQTQKKYSHIFKKIAPNIKYETAKKRMNQVIPSQHRLGTLDQADSLNVFQQHALLIQFLIYKTTFQRFLSNPETQSPPKYNDLEEIKKVIQDFVGEVPVSGVKDELFLKTVMEDTYHFDLFNALTQLIEANLKNISTIMELPMIGNTGSLPILFIIDQLIEDASKRTQEFVSHFQDLIYELEAVEHLYPNLEPYIQAALTDKESMEYVKNNMLLLFEKYESPYMHTSEIKGGGGASPSLDEKYYTNEIFKLVVKKYYESSSGQNAYHK